MDKAAARAEIGRLAMEARSLAPQFDAALKTADRARLDALTTELVGLLGKMAEIRIALGEGPELLEWCEQFAKANGVDLRGITGGHA